MMAKQPSSAMAGRDLEAVVRQLHGSNIMVGIHTFDRGMLLWISDRLYRVREDRVLKPFVAKSMWKEDSAALWLHAAALRLFPGSPYARDHLVTPRVSGIERKETAHSDDPQKVVRGEEQAQDDI
jgi:hypothetical protein